MNAFSEASKVEARSLEILRPFIEQRAFNGQYVLTSKGRLARELQKTVGDILMNRDDESVVAVELKAEETSKHGNFFLETWSNRNRLTPGWMVTNRADVLLYHFLEQDTLYAMSLPKLQGWAFRQGEIYKYPEKPQVKYTQRNDTWGRCVPIGVIERQVKFKTFHPLALSRTEDSPLFAEVGG